MGMSIVIPFHNAEKTIRHCVNSILHQNIDNLQIILVNDHSSDNSVEICKELKEDKRIILVNANGFGVSSARNTGLKYASKEIIGFCDSDDYFEENALNKIQNEFQDQTTEMVIAGYYRTTIDKQTGIQLTSMHLKWDSKITIKQAEKYILLDSRVMGSVWNKFYRNTLIKNIFFDEGLSYCEDMHFNCQVLYKLSKTDIGKPIKIVPFCVYHYVTNPKSVTNTVDALFDENNRLKYIVAMDEIEKIPCINTCYVRYKKFAFALSYIINLPTIGSMKKHRLLQTIKENYIYFLLCFLCLPRKNTKLTLQGIRALFKLNSR